MDFMDFQWDVVEQFNFLSSHKICLLNFPRDLTKMRVLRHKWDFLLFERLLRHMQSMDLVVYHAFFSICLVIY